MKSLSDPGGFVALVLVATVTKLTSSIDDIVWLLPFVSSPSRLANIRNAALYVLIMLIVVGIASAMAFGGGTALQTVLDEQAYWNTERVLGLASGICLFLYSVVLLREHVQDDGNSDEDEGEIIAEQEPSSLSALESELQKQLAAGVTPQLTSVG